MNGFRKGCLRSVVFASREYGKLAAVDCLHEKKILAEVSVGLIGCFKNLALSFAWLGKDSHRQKLGKQLKLRHYLKSYGFNLNNGTSCPASLPHPTQKFARDKLRAMNPDTPEVHDEQRDADREHRRKQAAHLPVAIGNHANEATHGRE